MQFSELLTLSAGKAKHLQAGHYSSGLRLRPNYLLYTVGEPLTEEQLQFLQEKEIPWAEYAQTCPLVALVAFLKSVEGGIYMPQLAADLGAATPHQCVFLLDPHLIDEFESLVSDQRRGVLIRRPLVASLNFQETISLGEL